MSWNRHLMLPIQVATAFAAFGIAQQIAPEARLVGPFLLLSPMLAISIAALPNLVRGRSGKYLESDEIRDRFEQFEHRLKKAPIVMLFSDEKYPLIVDSQAEIVYVNTARWNDLSWAERDFLLARSIAKLEGEAKRKYVGWLLLGAMLLAGVIAAVNLWTILASHAIAACLFFRGSIEKAKKHELDADRRAVQLTGDKKAALRVVRAEDKGQPYPLVEVRERVAAIEAVTF